MNFAWRKWKLGLVISVFLSLIVAGAGLQAGSSWRAFFQIFCAALLTHVLAFLKDHPVDGISFDDSNNSNSMKKIVPLLIFAILALGALALVPGCMTSKITTVTPGGTNDQGVAFAPSTNTVTIVNTNNLQLDASIIKRGTAAILVGVLKIPAVQKDTAVIPALKDAQTALNGILDGSNSQTTQQVLDTLGQSSNQALASQIGPLIDFASAGEQALIAKYGSGPVAGQISVAVARAVRDGLTTALASVQ